MLHCTRLCYWSVEMIRVKKIWYLDKNIIYWRTVCVNRNNRPSLFLEGLLEICGGIFVWPNYWKALLSFSGQWPGIFRIPWCAEESHVMKKNPAVNIALASCRHSWRWDTFMIRAQNLTLFYVLTQSKNFVQFLDSPTFPEMSLPCKPIEDCPLLCTEFSKDMITISKNHVPNYHAGHGIWTTSTRPSAL